ncbi:MAG: NAD-binding protein [Epsilonproteobacteria bacterium]|nr:NAD-binding protein [Campylobacterota bacterium]
MQKMIIYGYSKLAGEVAKLLKQKKYDFVILSNEQSQVQSAIESGHNAYEADLNDDDNLLKAGIGKSVSTFFCMSDDANSNLFITLSARALDKKLNIIALASNKESEKKMLLAGANRVFNPYEIGAQRLFRHMRKATVFSVLDRILFSSSKIKFGEVVITEESPFVGASLRTLDEEICDEILVIGVQSTDRFIYDTSRSRYHIVKDDVLVVMGEEMYIENLKRGDR